MSAQSTPLHGAQRGATGRNNKKSPRSAIERFFSSRSGLSERQRNAVELLLRGLSDEETAKQLNVDRGTIFRWRKSIPFAREMDRQRQILWQQSTARLQSLVEPALDILRAQLASDDLKLRLRAAAILLRFATPSRLGPPQAGSAAKSASSDADDYWEDVMAYVNAPLPGQPGAPEEMEDEEDEKSE